MEGLHRYVISLVEGINAKYGTKGYSPVVWLERPVPLYERIALYSVADVAVVTATRDGMNLMPYEYIVARQGPEVRGAGGRGRADGAEGAGRGRGGACGRKW